MHAAHSRGQTRQKIDVANITEPVPDYQAPYADAFSGCIRQAVARIDDLTHASVNLVRWPQDSSSNHRHWHTGEEEFVCVLASELTLLTDAGEQRLLAGNCAAVPKNRPDDHHLIDLGLKVAVYQDIGTHRTDDTCSYSNIDLHIDPEHAGYTDKDGTKCP